MYVYASFPMLAADFNVSQRRQDSMLEGTRGWNGVTWTTPPQRPKECWRSFNNHSDFFAAAAALGVDPTDQTIVNFGAALVHRHAAGSNNDESWNAFFSDQGRRHRLHMVAFEGSSQAIVENKKEFATSGGRFELDDALRKRLVHVESYVDTQTIVSELEARGVRRDFLLLKVDIDSFDVSIVAAITKRFSPHIIFMETTDWAYKLRFAALDPDQLQRAAGIKARYGATAHAIKKPFPCQGASMRMLTALMPKLGYLPVQNDPALRNSLFVRGRGASPQIWAASNFLCFPFRGIMNKHKKYNNSQLLLHVEHRCAEVATPYTLELDGVCCPTAVSFEKLPGRPRENGTVATKLPNCRCDDHFYRDEPKFRPAIAPGAVVGR